MCGGGGGSGGGDEGNMGIDDSVADQSAVSGDTSSVGDDPSGPGDDGVSTSTSTSTSTSSSTNDTNTNQDNFSNMDNFSMPQGQNFSAPNTSLSMVDDYGLYSSVTPDNVTTDPNAGLSDAAIASIGIEANQYGPGDITGFGGNVDGKDVSDYSMDATSLDDAKDKAKRGSLFQNPQNPLSYAINAISKIGPQNTVTNFNRGFAPTYGPDGNITGTTGYGIGMGMPGNDNNMSGAGSSVPGYSGFDATSPSMGMYGGATDIGGNENDELEIIRRNLSDEEEFPIAPAPLSDDLAINYLQDPYYLYSGQGNLYQPYGYAQNTLVDLLRTRNMTQPQQRAANLGLFGNPGDFS